MIVDVNVNLSRWPFRRLPHDETARLVEKLRKSGVTNAWAGSFEGLLHRDIAGVNERLAEECRTAGAGLLTPFGSINPTLPDWPDDLRRCHEVHHMPGVRLHPGYHGYTLNAPVFDELLSRVEERDLIVQLAVNMEDERTQHPLVQATAVDVAPLEASLGRHPRLKVVLLNSQPTLKAEQLTRLVSAGEVYVEIAMQEGVGGVSNLLKAVPVERVLFGSYFPFFILESSLLKLQESELGAARTATITFQNANRLIPHRASASSE